MHDQAHFLLHWENQKCGLASTMMVFYSPNKYQLMNCHSLVLLSKLNRQLGKGYTDGFTSRRDSRKQ